MKYLLLAIALCVCFAGLANAAIPLTDKQSDQVCAGQPIPFGYFVERVIALGGSSSSSQKP